MKDNYKKALMIIAPCNFRDEEYFKSRVVLQASGIQVKTSAVTVAEATGLLGGKAKIDIDLKDVKINDFDAFIFVGGEGVKVYFKDKTVINLVKRAGEENKIIGATSQADKILVNSGVLKNKKNNRIIIASEPEDVEKFGENLVKLIAK